MLQPWPPFKTARAEAIDAFERAYLQRLMALTRGNVTRAARLAGQERRQFGRLLKKHGLGHATLRARGET